MVVHVIVATPIFSSEGLFLTFQETALTEKTRIRKNTCCKRGFARLFKLSKYFRKTSKIMKTSLLLSSLAFALTASYASAQALGYPSAGAGLGGAPMMPTPPQPPVFGAPAPAAPTYPGMAPTLPPPALGSPYTGPTMVDPSMNYGGYQQPAPANSWGSTVQQSMGGGTPLLNYSYVEAGYRYVDPKVSGVDGSHGLGVALVMDLPTIFFLKGTFSWGSGSGEKTVKNAAAADYDLSTITIGGGAYMAITPKLHFVAELGLVYANFSSQGLNKSYTDGGIYVRPSLRYQVVDWMELQAGVTVSSTSDYDSKIIDIGGYFRVMPQFDLNLGADFGDANRTLKTGARLRW